MNIEEYRAMVAQEQEQAKEPETTPETPVEETPPAVDTPGNASEGPVGVETPEQVQEVANEETTPQTSVMNEIEIDGQTFTVEQIKELTVRQQNALKREQELARERRELEDARKLQEMIYANPQLAQELKQKGLPILDPQEKQMRDINQKYQDLLVEREIDTLKAKYEDFDPRTVVKYAIENRLNNLEDAYHLVKVKGQPSVQNASTPPLNASQGQVAPSAPSIDVEALKEQIRQDVLKELQSEVDTGSLMTSHSASVPVEDNSVRLSSAEIRIAKNLRMTPEEYMKWKSKK